MKVLKKRRLLGSVFVVILLIVTFYINSSELNWQEFIAYDVGMGNFTPDQNSLKLLNQLEVKGRSAKTNYSRDKFSPNWGVLNDCDMRNLILQRDLIELELGKNRCTVLTGVLNDPYSAKVIDFSRGRSTSSLVQIDHIVAVSDAWQKGAQKLSDIERYQFYNDPLNLIAVSAEQNQQKGDSDAASWLPKNKKFRCQYVARQVLVKQKYKLWVTSAEKSAIKRELSKCIKTD